jgi:acyl-CoA thioesterase-2
MSAALDELIRILTLEPIEVNLFRGVSPPEERFSASSAAKSSRRRLMAAYKPSAADLPFAAELFHSPGDPSIPVLYQIERSRDGKSFATRRVIAIQKGEQIFNMACSFQTPEDGYEHQSEMPPRRSRRRSRQVRRSLDLQEPIPKS